MTGFRNVVLRFAPLLLAAVSLVSAQQQQSRITPNFKDADITQIAEAVSAATQKTIIMDPRVRAQVTMYSSTPMDPRAFYEAFLSILQVYGFIAVPAGNIIKVMPDANARMIPGLDLPDNVSQSSDEMVTQVVDVKNVSAAQLVPILRPLMPQFAHLASYTPSNLIILSDHASNVNRIVRIIRRIDQVGDSDVEIIPLQNASAAEIVRVMNSLYTGGAQAAEAGSQLKIVADDRSNAVLLSGSPAQRLRIRALVANLDTPLKSGGDTQVRYLHFADAEKLAPKLKEQITGIAQATGAAPGGQAASPQAQAEKNATIWPDPATNALIITAPPKIMRAVMGIIDKLDIRRRQVLVEAIIAEVNMDKSAELGVNWAVFDKSAGANVPVGGFVSPVGGTSIVDLAAAAQNPASATTQLLQGTTLGIGRIAGTGVNFAAMLRAVRGDTSTNIIATPSTVTLDNQEAEIKVAQEVPFVTGQFTNTGSSSTANGGVNPFQTIQREEVGTILKVTPQITTEGNTVSMKISIESSSIGAKPAGAVDLVTNKRTITTNVLIEDGGVVVLGGLIEHDSVRGESSVPFLSKIPIIGLAFKTRTASVTKNNLMMFIRPKILGDDASAAYATDSKYKYMIEQERGSETREILPLLPGEKRPRLPPPPPPPGQPGAGSTKEKEEAAERNKREDVTRAPAATPSPDTTPSAAPAPNPPAPENAK